MACGALLMVLMCSPPSAAQDMPGTLSDDEESTSEMPPSLPDEAPGASAHHEEKPPIRFEGSLSAVLGYPFSADDAEASFGFGVTYGVGYGEIPLLLGLDFGMLNASGTSGAITIDQADDGGHMLATQDPHTRTFYFDAFLRVQPVNWPVRPYAEGFIGTK